MNGDITVRAFDPACDLDAWTEIHNQRSVAAWTLQIPYARPEQWADRLGASLESRQLVAEIDGQVVGCAGFQTYRGRRAHVGALGMGVREEFQGRGVGSALMSAIIDLADNWYNLRRIELEVYVDNEPAVRLYQKFGFQIEGTMRAYAYRDGSYVDAYVMARLRDNPPVSGRREETA